ncbi:MAG: gamma-glutamyl-gamma-aminobutyrate hydrolase family protein [Gammaproteobacteria bacterium]|nr:gamma-glutamyl-gamma-aminobutyrate hydrolase family protein [Gammaproteobacteria bacterium]
MTRRPVIGVTGPDHGGLAAWWFSALAIRRAGGRPRRIRPSRPTRIDQIDGLLLGGGADVSPGLYGQKKQPRPQHMTDRGASGWRSLIGLILFPLVAGLRRLLTTKHGGPDHGRDELEYRLVGDALACGMPIFGICRGMQLINVSLGGSLHQHLVGFYDEYPAIRSVLPRKRVTIGGGTKTAQLLGPGTCWVNALHSQAIDELADGLTVSAVESNGIVQAIERDHGPWLIGVQWHPEYLPQRRRQQALFRALVKAARPNKRP